MQKEALKKALSNAASTMRRLPRGWEERPHQGRSGWPEFRCEEGGSTERGRQRIPQIRPAPREIDEMYHLLDDLMQLSVSDRRLLWARACKIRWSVLQSRFQLSRTHLNRRYDIALNRLLEQKVNKMKKSA